MIKNAITLSPRDDRHISPRQIVSQSLLGTEAEENTEGSTLAIAVET